MRVERPAHYRSSFARGNRNRLSRELRSVYLRNPTENDSIARHHFAWADEKDVADIQLADGNIDQSAGSTDEVRYAGCGFLQFTDCCRCASLRESLEGFAARLHEHDHKSGQGLTDDRGGDD